MKLPLIALLALPALGFTPQYAATQEPLVVPFKGTHAFRNLLNVFGLQPLPTMDELGKRPASEIMLIVFGDLTCLDQLTKTRPGGLARFVEDGGAILVASDRQHKGYLWEEFKLVVSGNLPRVPYKVTPDEPNVVAEDLAATARVELHYSNSDPLPVLSRDWQRRQVKRYRESEECILVKSYLDPSHPIFAGCVQGIATNMPSYFHCGPKHFGEVLCGFPPFPTVSKPAFAVGANGKVDSTKRGLFLAGHGVFMNGMLAQPDNDNLKFTVNTLRWLTNDKKRKYCLMVVENEVAADFSIPLGEVPLPTSRMINDLLRGLEQENFFNRLILANASRESILRWSLALALVGLTLLAARRCWRARFRQDDTVPLLEVQLAQINAKRAPPLIRRQPSVLQLNKQGTRAK